MIDLRRLLTTALLGLVPWFAAGCSVGEREPAGGGELFALHLELVSVEPGRVTLAITCTSNASGVPLWRDGDVIGRFDLSAAVPLLVTDADVLSGHVYDYVAGGFYLLGESWSETVTVLVP